MPRFVIGLGSNLGSRWALVHAACDALASLGTVEAVSRVYRSAAMTDSAAPGPDYLNAAARVDSQLAPRELLGALHRIEARLGRTRRVKWGDRTIDLDVLAGDAPYRDAHLFVPHPGLLERPFAWLPFREVATSEMLALASPRAPGAATALPTVELPTVDRPRIAMSARGIEAHALDAADALAAVVDELRDESVSGQDEPFEGSLDALGELVSARRFRRVLIFATEPTVRGLLVDAARADRRVELALAGSVARVVWGVA